MAWQACRRRYGGSCASPGRRAIRCGAGPARPLTSWRSGIVHTARAAPLGAGLLLPVSWTCRLFRYGLTHHWQHLRRQQLNGSSHFRIWQAADIDLSEKPIVSEELAFVHQLIDDLLGTANEDWTGGGGALLVGVTGNLALEARARSVFAKISLVVRIELLKGSLGILRDMDVRRYSDLDHACIVSPCETAPPVGSYLVDEVGRRLGDVCQHQRQAE